MAAAHRVVALTVVDYRNPEYCELFRQRLRALDWLHEHPEQVPELMAYYRAGNYADFINDFGVTHDPRNADVGLPTIIPFVLFPKQREYITWLIERWHRREPGLCEKSRDMGVSWLSMALSATLCILHEGIAIGVGSRKTEYVDKIGTLKPLLPKARMFIEHLPEEFRGKWVAWRDAPYMRVTIPQTGSMITGEGGDDIGRGDRTTFYIVDEAAHLPRPDLVDAALSATTNCRIDVSSVNGMLNPFARKRHKGEISVFVFDWHDDPRKDQAWYDKQCRELDAVVVAQEIDRDYSASVSGIVIPGAWVRSCVDALKKLGIAPTGAKQLALDVADEGLDKNAICGMSGVEIDYLEEWSGKGGDIFNTVQHVFEVCDERGYNRFRYDADGLGAGVRGDARVINETRRAANVRRVAIEAFRGSDAVCEPDGIVEGTYQSSGDPNDRGRTNKDYFANRKAQGWWALRRRILNTHRWVTEGLRCNPDEILSINPAMPLWPKLVTELSQPTYAINQVGKIVINKKPPGMKSPNLGDAAMIRCAQNEVAGLNITPAILQAVARSGRRARR